MKYITLHVDDLVEIITFDDSLVHADVARPFKNRLRSAGVYSVTDDGVKITDKSESLGIGPQDDDDVLLNLFIIGHNALDRENLLIDIVIKSIKEQLGEEPSV